MIRYLTDAQIERAKRATQYSLEPMHSCNDAIRAAWHWLDAQKPIRKPTNKFRGLKHIIENRVGFYISVSDVEVAAHLHSDIYGTYPFFNLHGNFMYPADFRFDDLERFGERDAKCSWNEYLKIEDPTGGTGHVLVSRFLNLKSGPGMTMDQVRRQRQKERQWQ